MTTTALVVGSGPSVTRVRVPDGVTAIACNRAIEAVPAHYWIWVDRFHFDRSRHHPHARAAVGVGPDSAYRPARTWPCGPDELYLRGGTLTVAAHWATRLGVARIVFAACDALGDRDRYHAWDGAPLGEAGLEVHRRHLAETVEGIREIARAHSAIRFEDATPGSPVLGLPAPGDAAEFVARDERPIGRDASLPRGFGKLVAVTRAGESLLLWFSDSDGVVRVVRAAMGGDPFQVTLLDQVQIART
jgi:hypothetical protein